MGSKRSRGERGHSPRFALGTAQPWRWMGITVTPQLWGVRVCVEHGGRVPRNQRTIAWLGWRGLKIIHAMGRLLPTAQAAQGSIHDIGHLQGWDKAIHGHPQVHTKTQPLVLRAQLVNISPPGLLSNHITDHCWVIALLPTQTDRHTQLSGHGHVVITACKHSP